MLKDKPKVLSVETKTCLGKFEIRNSYVRSRNSVQDFKTKVFVDHFLRSVKKNPWSLLLCRTNSSLDYFSALVIASGIDI